MIKEFLKELKQDQEVKVARESEYPATELKHAGVHGSGNSTDQFYKVEVRTSYSEPTVLGQGRDAFVIDHCWRTLPIIRGATQWGLNVPIRPWHADAADHGLVGYTAAEAHRWGFLAFLEANNVGGSLCIETRLVKCEMRKSYEIKEIGVGEPLKEAFRVPHGKDTFSPRVPIDQPSELAKSA